MHVGPKIKRACRLFDLQHGCQDRQHPVEFFLIQAPVRGRVSVLVPGRDAGQLGRNGHRAAVIGPVQQKAGHDLRIAGDEAGTQSRHARTFRKTVKDDAALEAIPTRSLAGLQQARRRGVLIQIKLRIAFVRGDDEVEAIGQLQRVLQKRLRKDCAGGIAGAAQEQHLTAAPHGFGNRVEIRHVLRGGGAVDEPGLGARQKGCALVDLIEGIRHQDERVARVVHDRLHEREQRFPRTVDRKHHRVGMDAPHRQAEPPLQPIGTGRAQLGQAGGCRITAETVEAAPQGFQHEGRRGMLRLADRHGDVRKVGRGSHARFQARQPFKRVGVQALESGIHAAWRLSSACISRSRSRAEAAAFSGLLSKSVT